MGQLRTDSPVCRRIALAFLDFLQSVEPAPDVEPEGLDVARECLEEAFKLQQSSVDDSLQPGLLVNLFSEGAQYLNSNQVKAVPPPKASNTTSKTRSTDGCTTAPVPDTSKGKEQIEDPVDEEISRDELLGQLYAALDTMNFFAATPGGEEDHVQLTKTTNYFEEALREMEKLGNRNIDRTNLAEMFKTQGNQKMQSKSYAEAIDLYTFAIALSDKNAIYYCNRAAAYTQISKYAEAIMDCTKSIEIDPNYAKAYSRYGLVFYAQRKYREALALFLKALQLDPSSDSIRENIRVAEQKLNQEQRHAEGGNQWSGSDQTQSREQHQQPVDFAHAFMRMAAGAGSGQQGQEQDFQHAGFGGGGWQNATLPIDLLRMLGTAPGGGPGHATPPVGNTSGSNHVNINIQELPQQLSGIIGSVANLFASQNGQRDASQSGQQDASQSGQRDASQSGQRDASQSDPRS